MLCEFRIGDVRIGRAGGDGGQVALAEDRRHGLARAAHFRTDRGDHLLVGDHLAGVGRGLGRVVLAGGGGAVIERHQFESIARHGVTLVGAIDRHDDAVLDPQSILGVRTGERQVNADLDDLVGRPTRRAGTGQSGREGGTGDKPGGCATCYHSNDSLR